MKPDQDPSFSAVAGHGQAPSFPCRAPDAWVACRPRLTRGGRRRGRRLPIRPYHPAGLLRLRCSRRRLSRGMGGRRSSGRRVAPEPRWWWLRSRDVIRRPTLPSSVGRKEHAARHAVSRHCLRGGSQNMMVNGVNYYQAGPDLVQAVITGRAGFYYEVVPTGRRDSIAESR